MRHHCNIKLSGLVIKRFLLLFMLRILLIWIRILCFYHVHLMLLRNNIHFIVYAGNLFFTCKMMKSRGVSTLNWAVKILKNSPDSKVHGAKMGPIWGRQDPGGSHVGPMNFAIWGVVLNSIVIVQSDCCYAQVMTSQFSGSFKWHSIQSITQAIKIKSNQINFIAKRITSITYHKQT